MSGPACAPCGPHASLTQPCCAQQGQARAPPPLLSVGAFPRSAGPGWRALNPRTPSTPYVTPGLVVLDHFSLCLTVRRDRVPTWDRPKQSQWGPRGQGDPWGPSPGCPTAERVCGPPPHRYSPAGPRVLAVSALLGFGLEELKAELEDAVLRATGRQVLTLRVRLAGPQLRWVVLSSGRGSGPEQLSSRRGGGPERLCGGRDSDPRGWSVGGAVALSGCRALSGCGLPTRAVSLSYPAAPCPPGD